MPATAQRLQQPLARSVVAVHDASFSTVLISWRRLAQEPEDCTYNVYTRTGEGSYTLLNDEPIAGTCYETNTSAVPAGSSIAVTMIDDGVEGEFSESFTMTKQDYRCVFFDIDFETSILNPNDYRVKYAWPMDTDGNGVYDAVLVDRLWNGEMLEGTDKLQAYTLDGQCLWTIDMGPNVDICSGQSDMVTAYDIDCDGECEVIIRSSDGTRFWDATNSTYGAYANGSSVADTDGDGIEDYRQQSVRTPPFYVSIINATTGEEEICAELNYSEVTDGTDAYGRDNCADYRTDNYGTEYAFMAGQFAICYFDGIHPSLGMKCLDRTTDGTHHQYIFAWGFDWDDETPTNFHHYYTFSMTDKSPSCTEFHQLRVADTDGDGIDELIPGGFGVNPVKGLVFNAEIGHGDRFDVTDINPERPGLEVFAIQQSSLLGQVLYDATTGEHIREWYLPSVSDVGRGRAADVDATHKGCEMFSTMDGLYDCTGALIASGETTYPVEAAWWDGDLQRELIGSSGGSGYATNVMMMKYDGSRLIQFSSESSWAVHAATAIRPAFMGDMTGDWREEVILMKQNADSSTGLIGYSTNYASDYSFYTLQEDPHYRLDCTARGYYQMPCTGYYLGGDMPQPPLPPVITADVSNAFAADKVCLFDITGDNSAAIDISANPSALYLMNPKGHDYTFDGSLSGSMTLWKAQQGTATINGDLNYTGKTIISEGTLAVNGTISSGIDLRARGTLSGNATLTGGITFEGALNNEGCRLMPTGTDGVMTISGSLTMPGEVYIEVDADSSSAGRVHVTGDLTLQGSNTFTVDIDGVTAGEYTLMSCDGVLTANVDSICVKGLTGYSYTLTAEDAIILTISGKREACDSVVWTGAESGVWDYEAMNWEVDGEPTFFVPGDKAVFNDDATTLNVTISEDIDCGAITINSTLATPSIFSFTGMENIADSCTINLNRGAIEMAGDNVAISQSITLADTCTIYNDNSLSLKGIVTGSGYLIKEGSGQLNFTYGGENPFAGLIIRGGTVSQGYYNSTFGADGSPLRLEGGAIELIYNTSSSTRPILNHVITVAEGTENTITGTYRGAINGSISGSGNLTIYSDGVRNDIGASFTSFTGTLTAQGSNFRLQDNVTDMSATSIVMDEGCIMSHYGSNNSTQRAVTTKMGSLSSESSDCTLGHGTDSYIIGYNGEDATFRGALVAKTITKRGSGTWTLTSTASTADIIVYEGALQLRNGYTTAFTTGTTTIKSGGTLTGNGYSGSVTVESGGVIAAGNNGAIGILRLGGEVTLEAGSTMEVKVGSDSNDAFRCYDSVTHSGDTIKIIVDNSRTLAEGETITIFKGTGTHSGSYNLVTICNDEVVWEDSALLSDGTITVATVSASIDRVTVGGSDGKVKVYSAAGVLLRTEVKADRALEGLPSGVYIINGTKVIH